MENKEFDSIKIGLASPDQIRAWSYGDEEPDEASLAQIEADNGDDLFDGE